MKLGDRLQRFEGMVFGFVIGVALAFLAIFLWHQARGLYHISAWQRAVETQNLEQLASLLEREVTLAETAFEDDQPLPISEHLAFEFMPRLYRHHMRYAMELLKRGEIERFNQLREATGFVLLDLSGENLSGMSFAGSDFSGAALERTDLSHTDLSDCRFIGTDLANAILTGARLDRTHFDAATMSGATLTAAEGIDATFTDAVLAAANLSQVVNLENARFDGATMGDVNLFASRLSGATLDGASLQLASAVDADLSVVASMADADLTGANLSGTQLAPEKMSRAWLVGADGLDPTVIADLHRHGVILRPEEVIDQVDPRIVDGFRAQVEADSRIAADPDTRRRVLINWLKGYYMR
jgi:uncharacterized protein YjbI with pentapeptide repeats